MEPSHPANPAGRSRAAPVALPEVAIPEPLAPVAGPADAAIAHELGEAGIAVVPGFIEPGHVRQLREEAAGLHAAGGFRAAGVGRGRSFRVRPDVRSDQVCWLEPHRQGEAVTGWLARMEGLRQSLNSSLFLGLFGYEAHFSVYPRGAFYRTHVDRFADAPLRTVSAVLYLNPRWKASDGGWLRVYQDAPGARPWRDVSPEAGTLVVFMSDRFPHEVLPANRRRWSLTGWFTRRP
jgi:SM-20-related protein